MALTLTITEENGLQVVDDQLVITVGQTGPAGPAGQGVPVGGTTGQVLRKASGSNYDTEWAPAATGSGDVVGPSTSVDGRVALFDGTTGKLLKQSTAAPVLEGDARLTDSRTPTTHASTHATGGTDAISIDGAQITSGTVPNLRLATSGTASGATYLDGARTWSRPTAVWNRQTFSNADHDIGSTFAFSVMVVQIGTLSATRTVTLPSTGSFAVGQQVMIWSGAGVSSTNRLIVAPVSGQTINGASTFEITQPNRLVRIMSNRNATSSTNPNWVVQTADVDAADITTGTVAYGRLPVGTTASTVAAGDDARLTDARTPTAHKSTHATGGTDALSPSDIGAVPTSRTINGLDLSANRTLTAADVGAAATSHVHSGADITSGTVGTARLGTGTANNTTYLRGDGTWATPAGGGSVNPQDGALIVAVNVLGGL